MELKLPPPLLFAFCLLLIYLLPRGEHYPLPQWLGFLFAGFGIAVSIAGLYALQQAKTTISPLAPQQSSLLVTSGIYRFSRNPMYLGLMFLLIAWAVWLNRYFASLVIIGFVYYLNWFQIKPEEQYLQQKFGEDFTQYCQQVRRWL
ncbi:isoprenylcysteine carboxylmethyltransferase family protein [Actinobacillus equuli subsp. haemolyticus]|uniref:methyltransferase family protein n=1 Tax=Actinobacillus equuli TaxID=718 RepID=UPI0024428098|nr:isoprenylcysteine carboxylmethyltransferase family protein [Actinobacillus equuli]WGE52141.1 isoprenylcysteine carboxylmethyltransferase family protein [Actinobacillus equuli subsp. haemolyticus]WGE62474.1 isoprenylcysteine carboxylmethyltransferase family protein [Actinobacillus equuli subsp. haemolyticus]WGE72102.1 isoprenylcysteine carboxylmethyltransferase family protein [Actinobacillus equuli subsp. haemolyticus]